MLNNILFDVLIFHESSNIKKFSSPEKLSDWMSENIKYGFMATNNKVYLDFDQFIDYKLQSPYQVYKNKVGVCWDQTFFEAYIFKRYLKIKYKIFFIITDDENNTTDTFLLYYKNNKVYYFENSFESHRGIHEFNNEDEVFLYVINNMKKSEMFKNYELYEIIDNIKYGISSKEFISFCMSQKRIFINKKHKLNLMREESIIQESKIKSKKLYFLSNTNMDQSLLQPRIPNNYLVKNGYEDDKTKRICFAPSIDKCLMGLSRNLKGERLCVHVAVDYDNLKMKNQLIHLK